MTAQANPYVRVYASVVDDPKFEGIYSDPAAFGSWVKLLLLADGAWPAPAPLPRWISDEILERLVASGLIDLFKDDHFKVHGLDAERQGRSDHARKAARARWEDSPSSAQGNARGNAPSSAGGNAQAMHSEPLHSEPSRAEPSLSRVPRASARENGIIDGSDPWTERWNARYRLPPSPHQEDLLRDMYFTHEGLLLQWMDEAPKGAKSGDLIKVLLERRKALRAGVARQEESDRRQKAQWAEEAKASPLAELMAELVR